MEACSVSTPRRAASGAVPLPAPRQFLASRVLEIPHRRTRKATGGNGLYQDPAVRKRLAEFLGGGSLEQATAFYLTHMDGCAFGRERLRPARELDWFLDRGLDVARSLADTESLLLHLDVEYVNFDEPEEAYRHPQRAFALQEPVIRTIGNLLREWGIRPLHLVTGQGHHFVWRIALDGSTARRIAALSPAPELMPSCMERVPSWLRGPMMESLQNAFGGLSLLMEYLVHRVKEQAAPLAAVPVEITAVQVGPVDTGRREIVSLDISEYGDPISARMIRMPFTKYLKPGANSAGRSHGNGDSTSCLHAIPLQGIEVKQALAIRRDQELVKNLARSACVRIPRQEEGTRRLLDDYLSSRLRQFHACFYAARHDPRERWPETYGRTPLGSLPECARHVIEHPNDLLLKPAGMQLVTRSLLAEGWHPRHIAGLIRSKFEDPAFGWGAGWQDYHPAIRADFYTRVFAGLCETGLDRLVDFNCVSLREKGFCFQQCGGCSGLGSRPGTLLSRQCT